VTRWRGQWEKFGPNTELDLLKRRVGSRGARQGMQGVGFSPRKRWPARIRLLGGGRPKDHSRPTGTWNVSVLGRNQRTQKLRDYVNNPAYRGPLGASFLWVKVFREKKGQGKFEPKSNSHLGEYGFQNGLPRCRMKTPTSPKRVGGT